jgi:hypothetical protein
MTTDDLIAHYGQLMLHYAVTTIEELIEAQQDHIARLYHNLNEIRTFTAQRSGVINLKSVPAPAAADRAEETIAMPAKTKKQQRFMGMCTTPEGRKKAKGACPPKKVAKKFARTKKRSRG